MPSLDVLALKMIGRQAPRWVLQVDVLVPLIQETWNPRGSVCGTPSGHVGDSRDGARSARVCRGLGRSCAVFKMCTAASLPWEDRGCGEAQLLLHREMGKVRYTLRDGKTMKIVGSFYVVSGVPHCDLMAFSDSGKSCMWLAFVWSDGEPETAGWLASKFSSRELCASFYKSLLYDVEDHLFVCVTKSEVVTNEEYARVVFELGETSLASCGAPLL